LSAVDDPVVITVADETYEYFDLDTGEFLADGAAVNNTEWDLKFGEERRIFTNSGDTATDEGSGGLGGVYYAGEGTVDAVTTASFDAAKEVFDDEDADWTDTKHYDKKVWVVAGMSGASQGSLNAITFIGYEEGDGSEATPYSGYEYDATPFYYNAGGMPPTYVMNDEYIYIIRHGDGKKHSAIQITSMESSADGRVYGFKFANLD
jgi:hypothetical protein